MNITGYKWKLEKARDLLEKVLKDLDKEKSKRGRRRDTDKIEYLHRRVRQIKEGMSSLRHKIKKLRDEREKKKRRK